MRGMVSRAVKNGLAESERLVAGLSDDWAEVRIRLIQLLKEGGLETGIRRP